MTQTDEFKEKARILLVEDNKELAELIHDYLAKKAFHITTISDGAIAVDEILRINPDLVILDVMLPGKSGLEICREVRNHYLGAILMLTALDEDMDQIIGLEMGADDYIIKPVHPRLLLTRIKTLLRRWSLPSSTEGESNHAISMPPQTVSLASPDIREKPQRSVIEVDRLKINLGNRTVVLDDRLISLTTAEFELLLLLAQDVGQVVDRETIVQQLRGFDYDGMDRSIDRRVSRLRRKLQGDDKNTEFIKTIRGRGYQLCVEY